MDDLNELEDFIVSEDVLRMMEESETGIQLPTQYLSYSQVSLYQTCPERYRQKYVLRKPTPGSSNLSQGRLVHSVLEDLHRFKRDHRRMPALEQAQDLISDKMSHYFADCEVWDEKVPDLTTAENSSRELVGLYMRERLPGLEVRDVERKLATHLRGKIPFVGYVDLIEKSPMDVGPDDPFDVTSLDIRPTDGIRDIKVTGKTYPASRVANGLQLTLYAQILGVEDVGYDLLVQKKKSEYVPQRALRSPAEKEHALDVVEGIASAISQGVFPKTDPESWACNPKWCPFWNDCRGRKLSVSVPAALTPTTQEE